MQLIPSAPVPENSGLRPLSNIAKSFVTVAALYDSNCWGGDADDAYRRLLEAYVELGVHIHQRHANVKHTRAVEEKDV